MKEEISCKMLVNYEERNYMQNASEIEIVDARQIVDA